MAFVNRHDELATLETWWRRPGASMGQVWGRRRVGKTALVSEFAAGRRSVFHTARGVGLAEELATLATKLPADLGVDRRFAVVPFVSWEDVLSTLAAAARDEPLLLVLDEYPELAAGDPAIDTRLRASWEEERAGTNLKVLLCGSAVRSMEAMAEYRSPLHGRFDLRLLLHPFRPHEAALMLPDLAPADRARAWSICDGTPLYLSWWDQSAGIQENIRRLCCEPGAPLRTEGEFILATDGVAGGLARQVLGAIAVGRNRHSEIVDAVRSDRHVSRVLHDLERLRLVERVTPVTEEPGSRGGRTTYRIADNFLAFWLGPMSKFLGEIDRGMGELVARTLTGRLDHHIGPRYEDAFRSQLRRMAIAGEFGAEVVRIGPFWTAGHGDVEIDAVVLAGTPAAAVAVGECKWADQVAASALLPTLARRAQALPRQVEDLRYIICARTEVTRAAGVTPLTAADLFA
ncbi:MAG: ATP-binding protein [Natronosporangium sp.]